MICHSFYHTFIILPILSELQGIDCWLLTLQSQQKSFVFELNTLKLLLPEDIVQTFVEFSVDTLGLCN